MMASLHPAPLSTSSFPSPSPAALSPSVRPTPSVPSPSLLPPSPLARAYPAAAESPVSLLRDYAEHLQLSSSLREEPRRAPPPRSAPHSVAPSPPASHPSVWPPPPLCDDGSQEGEEQGSCGVAAQSLHRRLRVLSVVDSDGPTSSAPSPPGSRATGLKRRRPASWTPPLAWLWLLVALLSWAGWLLSSQSLSVWNVALLEGDGQLVLATHLHSATCSTLTHPLPFPHASLLRLLAQSLHVVCLSAALALSSAWWLALLNSTLCVAWRLWQGRRGQARSQWLAALSRCAALGFMSGRENSSEEAGAKRQ